MNFMVFQSFKKEIHRRIDIIPKIVYEPRMINENDSQYIMPPDNHHLPPIHCRLKAMDDVKLLGKYLNVKSTEVFSRQIKRLGNF